MREFTEFFFYSYKFRGLIRSIESGHVKSLMPVQEVQEGYFTKYDTEIIRLVFKLVRLSKHSRRVNWGSLNLLQDEIEQLGFGRHGAFIRNFVKRQQLKEKRREYRRSKRNAEIVAKRYPDYSQPKLCKTIDVNSHRPRHYYTNLTEGVSKDSYQELKERETRFLTCFSKLEPMWEDWENNYE